MATQHDKQFKLDAIQYYQDHKDLGVRGCAENLGIGYSTLTKWLKDFRESFHSIIKREWLNRFKNSRLQAGIPFDFRISGSFLQYETNS